MLTHLLLILYQVRIGEMPGLIEHDPDVGKAQSTVSANRCTDIPLTAFLRLGLKKEVDGLNKESDK